mmetsp:Transcript_10634/g.18738  ORF Transcript_10634/g.18738 Transcript_10634/m.18738 type:complete len:229 (+) Transcript_10634:345-1031(+)
MDSAWQLTVLRVFRRILRACFQVTDQASFQATLPVWCRARTLPHLLQFIHLWSRPSWGQMNQLCRTLPATSSGRALLHPFLCSLPRSPRYLSSLRTLRLSQLYRQQAQVYHQNLVLLPQFLESLPGCQLYLFSPLFRLRWSRPPSNKKPHRPLQPFRPVSRPFSRRVVPPLSLVLCVSRALKPQPLLSVPLTVRQDYHPSLANLLRFLHWKIVQDSLSQNALPKFMVF